MMEKNKEKEVKQKRRKQGKDNADLAKGVNIANKAVKKVKERKEKIQQHSEEKKSNKLKYIFFVIVIAVIFLIIKYRHVIGITFSKEVSEKDAIVIETATSDNKIYAYQNEILVYSKGKLLTYTKYGKNTWEYTFDETFVPEISISGKYIQVVNKNNGYLYVFNNKYESCRKKIDGTIKKASINSKGESVIHYSKEGLKSNIGVYDKKGNQEYEVTLSTNNIAKVALSNNGKYLLFYEIDTEGISINSNLKVIDLKDNSKVETILKVDNDIIYDIEFNNSNICVLTSNKIYNCNITSNAIREFDISDKNISNISIDKTGISYISKEISDENNTVKILNGRYKEIGRHTLEENVKDFIYKDNLVYAIGNKEINIYNRWGMHVKKYSSDSTITNFILFNNGKNFAINYSNKIVVVGV